MISITKSIYNILSGTTLIGTEIYPLILPENSQLPSVVIERDGSPEYTKDGVSRYVVNATITILSSTYNNSITIATDVTNRMVTTRGEVGDVNFIDVKFNSINEDYIENTYIQSLTFTIYCT